MKARRLASVALVGLLLAGGLAACRADPSVVAYVDQVKITEAEVDGVMASIEEVLSAELEQELGKLRESLDEQVRQGAGVDQAAADEQYVEQADARQAQVDEQISTLRDRVIEMRILTEAADQYAATEGLEVPEADPQQHTEEVGLPADHPFVEVVAEFRTVIGVLQDTVEPAEPTEADQREVYDNLVAQGMTGTPFAEAQPLLTAEILGVPVAVRDLFQQIVDRADITLNPRYQLVYRVPVPVGNAAESWLSVPLGDPAVIDAG